MNGSPQPIFFASPDEFREWLAEHHSRETEVVVGYWKTSTGKPSMTWSQSVDEALCYGWIDGVRRRIDDDSYTIRFTPRKPRSTWSLVNIRKVEQLSAEGRMTPAGLAAFAARREANSGTYSHERAEAAALQPAEEQLFRDQPQAWTWFEAQAPSYRRAALHWVTSAKRPETRARRLAVLIADSAAGLRIGPMRRPGRPPQPD